MTITKKTFFIIIYKNFKILTRNLLLPYWKFILYKNFTVVFKVYNKMLFSLSLIN